MEAIGYLIRTARAVEQRKADGPEAATETQGDLGDPYPPAVGRETHDLAMFNLCDRQQVASIAISPERDACARQCQLLALNHLRRGACDGANSTRRTVNASFSRSGFAL
ncbi:integrase family domain protein [Paraburkholderia xenovorans LB400]|nr:integrase family domain protein [Paraburkholderia xenovorans LB400]